MDVRQTFDTFESCSDFDTVNMVVRAWVRTFLGFGCGFACFDKKFIKLRFHFKAATDLIFSGFRIQIRISKIAFSDSDFKLISDGFGF